MSIKVVCVTISDAGSEHLKVILERPSTPANLIEIADRFTAITRSQADLHGKEFKDVRCYLDEHYVQTRFLIEFASTAFRLMREKLFGDNGFTIYKHEPDVLRFMKLVREGAQPTQMPPPLWTGILPAKPKAPKTAKAAKMPATCTEVVESLSGKKVVELKDAAENESAAVKKPVRATRMKPSNLGSLGNLNSTA